MLTTGSFACRGDNGARYTSLGLHAPPSDDQGEVPWSLGFKVKGSGLAAYHPLNGLQTRTFFDDITSLWTDLADRQGGWFAGTTLQVVFTRHGQDMLLPTLSLTPEEDLRKLWQGLVVPENLESVSFAIASNIK